jgi:hypothetical protein
LEAAQLCSAVNRDYLDVAVELCMAAGGPWRIERLRFPAPDRADDHAHLLVRVGDRGAVCSINQPAELSDAEADAIAALLDAARDLRVALSAARRALEGAQGVPCRPWLMSLISEALAKANRP